MNSDEMDTEEFIDDERDMVPVEEQAPTIEDAIALAAEAHRGQIDKAGQPYILHPLRLMLAMDTNEERMAGVLHDIVEDTDVTLDELRDYGFPATVVEAVELLTHPGEMDYFAYITRLRDNPVARKVKLADLRDNMNFERITDPTEKDFQRIEKYRAALSLLMTSG